MPLILHLILFNSSYAQAFVFRSSTTALNLIISSMYKLDALDEDMQYAKQNKHNNSQQA